MSKTKVAIQGELGAYSHIAAKKLYKDADIKTFAQDIAIIQLYLFEVSW